jgi:hypothetical protein
MRNKAEPSDQGMPVDEIAETAPAPAPKTKASVAVHAAREPKPEAWKHAAASALHGWAEHAHHEGKPMEIASADYDAALKAIEAPGPSGEYEPHKPALSKHAAIANRS